MSFPICLSGVCPTCGNAIEATPLGSDSQCVCPSDVDRDAPRLDGSATSLDVGLVVARRHAALMRGG